MSNKNLNEVLYYAQGNDFDRETMRLARLELDAYVAAAVALRRLFNAFPPAGSAEESDAIAQAYTALAALNRLEEP